MWHFALVFGKRLCCTKNIRAEVIVIDNASADKSVDMVRKQFHQSVIAIWQPWLWKTSNQAKTKGDICVF